MKWEALITPATIVAMMLFGWSVLGRVEDRLVNNANTAHQVIETNISRVEYKVDQLDAKFDQLLIALAGQGITLPAKPSK